jgi:hypothetical protein
MIQYPYEKLSSLLIKNGIVVNANNQGELIDKAGERLVQDHNILIHEQVGEFLVDMFELGSILVTRTRKSFSSTCNEITLIHPNE